MSIFSSIPISKPLDNIPSEESFQDVKVLIKTEEKNLDFAKKTDIIFSVTSIALAATGAYLFCSTYPIAAIYLFYPNIYAISYVAKLVMPDLIGRANLRNHRMSSLRKFEELSINPNSYLNNSIFPLKCNKGEAKAVDEETEQFRVLQQDEDEEVEEDTHRHFNSIQYSPSPNHAFLTTSDYRNWLTNSEYRNLSYKEFSEQTEKNTLQEFYEIEPELKTILDSPTYKALSTNQQRFYALSVCSRHDSDNYWSYVTRPLLNSRAIPADEALSNDASIREVFQSVEQTLFLLKLIKRICEVALPAIVLIGLAFSYSAFFALGANALATVYLHKGIYDILNAVIAVEEELLRNLQAYSSCIANGLIPNGDDIEFNEQYILNFINQLKHPSPQKTSAHRDNPIHEDDEGIEVFSNSDHDDDDFELHLLGGIQNHKSKTPQKPTSNETRAFLPQFDLKAVDLNGKIPLNSIAIALNSEESAYTSNQKHFFLIKIAELLYTNEIEESKEQTDLTEALHSKYRQYQAEIQLLTEYQRFFSSASSLASDLLQNPELINDHSDFMTSFNSKRNLVPYKTSESSDTSLETTLATIASKINGNNGEQSKPIDHADIDNALLEFRGSLAQLFRAPHVNCSAAYFIDDEEFSANELVHPLVLFHSQAKDFYQAIFPAIAALKNQEEKKTCTERLSYLIKDHAKTLAEAFDARGTRKRISSLHADALLRMDSAGKNQGERIFKLHQLLQPELRGYTLSSSISSRTNTLYQYLDWDESCDQFSGSDEDLACLIKGFPSANGSENLLGELTDFFTNSNGNSAHFRLLLKKEGVEFSSQNLSATICLTENSARRFTSITDLFPPSLAKDAGIDDNLVM